MQENISNLIEAVFKLVAWTLGLAVLAASLKEYVESGEYAIVFGGVAFILVMFSLSYIWSLINIAIPFCNLFFPDVKYVDAFSKLKTLNDKNRRMRVFWYLAKKPESILFLALYVLLFFGLQFLFDSLLRFQVG